jgi:hypothetical protein
LAKFGSRPAGDTGILIILPDFIQNPGMIFEGTGNCLPDPHAGSEKNVKKKRRESSITEL